MKLEKILKYNDFGNLKQINSVLFDLSKMKTPVKILDVEKFYANKKDYDFPNIRAVITLLEFLEYVSVKSGEIRKVIAPKLNREEVLTKLLHSIVKDKDATEFVRKDTIRFDTGKNSFYIPIAAIPLRYSQIRNLLIGLGIFKVSRNLAFIETSFVDVFKSFISEVNEVYFELNDSMTLMELKRLLETKEVAGREAEEIALKFEKNRLVGHTKFDEIQIISDLSVAEGFDIVSFENLSSDFLNRFIEVKSFNNLFYWSANEIEKAKVLKDRYYLYLVKPSTEKIEIIKNPYKEIFEKDIWKVSPDGYRISKY